ncbi:MAG: metalloregulator ArsR/SmtB family transcription factor [Sphingomonadales bacterium]|nr:metalloregulator ArsR/SmtB family transcription factor [Sphingomonadales bacterium]
MTPLLNIMRALADPTRMRITLLIRQLELSVSEVVQILGQSQPRVSRHIKILDEAGIAERRREGAWVFLRPGPMLSHPAIEPLFSLPGTEDSRPVLRDLARLEEVRSARTEMAAAYFDAHAEQWDQIRSLHIAEAEVETAMRMLLGEAPVGRVLDIGTGTGRMIELFARHADRFVALDNSVEMLRLARAKLGGMEYAAAVQAHTEIVLGDFNTLPFPDGSFDTILFHQVLHYAQHPERAIAEAARVLAPEGRLLVVDFAAHDVEELRSVHAHARLGFTDESMARAFGSAGLVPVRTETLAGGKLAVKIWLGQRGLSTSESASESPKLRLPLIRNVA